MSQNVATSTIALVRAFISRRTDSRSNTHPKVSTLVKKLLPSASDEQRSSVEELLQYGLSQPRHTAALNLARIGDAVWHLALMRCVCTEAQRQSHWYSARRIRQAVNTLENRTIQGEVTERSGIAVCADTVAIAYTRVARVERAYDESKFSADLLEITLGAIAAGCGHTGAVRVAATLIGTFLSDELQTSTSHAWETKSERRGWHDTLTQDELLGLASIQARYVATFVLRKMDVPHEHNDVLRILQEHLDERFVRMCCTTAHRSAHFAEEVAVLLALHHGYYRMSAPVYFAAREARGAVTVTRHRRGVLVQVDRLQAKLPITSTPAEIANAIKMLDAAWKRDPRNTC